MEPNDRSSNSTYTIEQAQSKDQVDGLVSNLVIAKTGIEIISAERTRQVDGEGWHAEHDDCYTRGQLAKAAKCYATPLTRPDGSMPDTWPFGDRWWKPTDDPIRNLAKAGALIAAEIDRMQRFILKNC